MEQNKYKQKKTYRKGQNRTFFFNRNGKTQTKWKETDKNGKKQTKNRQK